MLKKELNVIFFNTLNCPLTEPENEHTIDIETYCYIQKNKIHFTISKLKPKNIVTLEFELSTFSCEL